MEVGENILKHVKSLNDLENSWHVDGLALCKGQVWLGCFRHISRIFIFKGITCVNYELVNSLNGETSRTLLRHLNESQSSRYYWLIQKILYIHARRLGSGQKRRELTIGIYIYIWVVYHKPINISRIHTFLFFFLLQLFFIWCLCHQRNSLHLFLKFLKFALVHLDTNTQRRGQLSVSRYNRWVQLAACTTFYLRIHKYVLRFLCTLYLGINSSSRGMDLQNERRTFHKYSASRYNQVCEHKVMLNGVTSINLDAHLSTRNMFS